ncbi:condensation domain-containing protein [Micromonospora sp. DT229]|uniref:condensation domain-containing protein n=1 Tax=Micromonospora sp. DT229 TaxID=3393430 RepID=UPI003CEBBFE7
MTDELYAMPASAGQERMYLIHQMHRGHTPFHITGALRIRGPMDAAALADALNTVVQRHEALRTVLRLDRTGQLLQVIRASSPVELTREQVHPAAVVRRVEDFARTPFDLDRGPLVRAALLGLGTDDHVFAVVIHHAAADGWSLGVLLDDLGAAYRARLLGREPELPDLPLQYADYAVWQREQLDSGAFDGQLAFWRRTLDGARGLRLPSDGPAEGRATQVSAQMTLAASEHADLDTYARSRGATTFMVLVAAFAATFTAWSGAADLVLVTPVAGRTQPDLDRVVGLFSNTVALRVDTAGDPTFDELVGRVRRTCLDAFSHQDVPFERVAEALAVRGRRPEPVARVMVAYGNTPPAAARPFPGASVEPVELPANTGGLDLAAALDPAPDGGIRGYLTGDGSLFGEATVGRVARAVNAVLDDAAALGGLRLSELPLPVGAER